MEADQQNENSDCYSILHNETVTVKLFEILEMLPGMCLTCAIKCFPSMGNPNPSLFLGSVEWKLVKQ